jgi:hypothetical protein
MDRKKLDGEEKSDDADQTDLGEPASQAKIFRNITSLPVGEVVRSLSYTPKSPQ